MKTLFCIILLFYSFVLYPQVSTTANLGPSFPISLFAEEGYAATGVGGGIQINLHFGRISAFGSVDLYYNDIQKEFKEDWPTMKMFSYYNIPVTTGINYDIIVRRNVKMYIQTGIVYNMLKLSDLEIGKIRRIIHEVSLSYGARIGAGFCMHDRVQLSLNYYCLSQHKIKGNLEYWGSTEYFYTIKQQISYVSLLVGYRF